ncbi:MAG: hypothetical protein ABIA75_05870 [Candidatus Neomarinimicrobiota bacterium]
MRTPVFITRSRFAIRPLSVVALALLILLACSAPTGLEPVTGVEGRLETVGTWPDSIRGIAVVVLDSADFQNPQDHLVAYSELLLPGASILDYFIQLNPGAYLLVPVGILLDPGYFVANIDSILTGEDIPLVALIDPDNLFESIRSIGLGRAGVVKYIDAPIIIRFD